MKWAKKIWKFIYSHPIWTLIISWLIIYFAYSLATKTYNPGGCLLLATFIFSLFSPFIRRARSNEARRNEAEFLAKQIALEQDKLAHPEKYETEN